MNETEKFLNLSGDGIRCAVGILVNNGRILIGHRHYTKDKWKDVSVWTIPGGRSDAGETIEQTLRREVEEEVGITKLEIKDFIGEVAGAKEGDIVLIFYCLTTDDAKLMEPEKFSEWKWISVDEYVSEEKYSGFNSPAKRMIINYLKSVNNLEATS